MREGACRPRGQQGRVFEVLELGSLALCRWQIDFHSQKIRPGAWCGKVSRAELSLPGNLKPLPQLGMVSLEAELWCTAQ